MDKSPSDHSQSYTRLEWLQFGLFWSWNLIFLAFMSLGFAPIVLPETLTAVRTGLIPAMFLLFALVLAIIPVIAIIIGLTALRRSPRRLFALGYVIEGPLMLMLAVRFFAINQGTPGTTMVMALALLGMAAFTWNLLDRRNGERNSWIEAIRLSGLTLMALISLYAATWIAFYAIPLGVEGLRWLERVISNLPRNLADLFQGLGFVLREQPLMLPFRLLGFILLLYTATLFILTPVVVPVLSLRAWWKSFNQLGARVGKLPIGILCSAVVVISGAVFYLANQQPQGRAFALLDQPPASVHEAQLLLNQSDEIRKGLLNAYLAPFRYISAGGEVRHISDMYANTFRIPRPSANAVQRLYEQVASPLLYKPVHKPEWANLEDNRALTSEPQEAARLYQQFFDAPITVAERDLIVKSVRSTWDSNRAEEAWQAVDDREVYLVQQEVNLQEHVDWADAELHEVYQNQTADQQEVVYYFSLPESAVLTGVWLGDNPDKSKAYPFQVAPRGAAQTVYREQKMMMMDPALLEQIGPRQYRLRIFPVPAMRMNFDQRSSRSIVEEAAPLHMWLSWREMAGEEGWSMPQLAFLRNVYWDGKSERLVNNQPMKTNLDEWLPRNVPSSGPVEPIAHRVDFPNGQTVIANPVGLTNMPVPAASLKLAVVVDRSYSMQAKASDMAAALESLKKLDYLASPVDVYLTASDYRGEQPEIVPLASLDGSNITYFGGQNAAQLIDQFGKLRTAMRSNQQYDAVIVLTDGTGYELGQNTFGAIDNSFPLWMVHLGDDISLGYDDQTLEAIQTSGGGVAGSLDEALKRILISQDAKGMQGSASAPMADLVDGYLWTVLPTSQVDASKLSDSNPLIHAPDDLFTALAARHLVLAQMQRDRGAITQPETLDALHNLAIEQGIVTPYSSMIVLVNLDQKKRLEALSERNDRFQREVESVGETVAPSPLPLAGVPEPQEWLLLGLAAALLVYLSYKKRVASAQTI